MSWHLLEKSLDEVSKQSTVFGKLWITFLFVFRVIAVTRMGETIYADEQAAFRCNIKQIGCENVCFNEFSPISHVRFWGFQIIIVATPALMFLVYTTHAVSCIPSAKLIRRKMQFLKSKKQTKSKISKNTSKTTQSSGKNTTSTSLPTCLKQTNANATSAWTKQKQDLVSKWKITPNPDFIPDYISVKGASPPAYQENNAHLYLEEISLGNANEARKILKEESSRRTGERRVFKSACGSDSPRSYLRQNNLFKEISLNRVRRHSDGDLNCLPNFDAAQQFSTNNVSVGFCVQASQASRSPPHYSVIHLSQLTDLSKSNCFESSTSEITCQRQTYLCSSEASSKPACGRQRKQFPTSSAFWITNSQSMAPSSGTTKSQNTNKRKVTSNECSATQRSETQNCKNTRNNLAASFDNGSSGYFEFARRIAEIERRIALVYFFQCVCRLLLETVFLYAQYRLFQFEVPELFKCQRWPCPNTVNCYVSRPEEKSVMLYFMFYLTAGCILLALCETVTLIIRYIKDWVQAHKMEESFSDIDVVEKGEGKSGQLFRKKKTKNFDVSKHPYLLEGYTKILRINSIDDRDETTSEETKSTKSSNSESETEDAQANSFNSQDNESIFGNDLVAEAGDLNNEENEAAEIFV